jgi:fatty-acyl-CoA synthase
MNSRTINHAEDRVLLVDASLLRCSAKCASRSGVEHIVVLKATARTHSTAALASACGNFVDDDLDACRDVLHERNKPPKGVVCHRAIVLHSLVHGVRDCLDLGEADVVCPVVPMFHVNAWGLPFGHDVWRRAGLPGRFLDAVNLLGLMEQEGVTITAGVP